MFKCLTCDKADWLEIDQGESTLKEIWKHKDLFILAKTTQLSNGLEIFINHLGSDLSQTAGFLKEHENHHLVIASEYQDVPYSELT